MKNEARDKFLSKLIGEEPFVCVWCGTGANQKRLPVACSAPDGDGHLFKVANINFSTWEGFGKLKEFMDNSEECYRIYDSYLDKIAENGNHVADTFERITPDSFADHVCDEFKFYGR